LGHDHGFEFESRFDVCSKADVDGVTVIKADVMEDAAAESDDELPTTIA
jgi:hypothetical protein